MPEDISSNCEAQKSAYDGVKPEENHLQNSNRGLCCESNREFCDESNGEHSHANSELCNEPSHANRECVLSEDVDSRYGECDLLNVGVNANLNISNDSKLYDSRVDENDFACSRVSENDSDEVNVVKSSVESSTTHDVVKSNVKLPLSISARLGQLQFHLSGKFRVLQCADIQENSKVSKDTIRLIEAACDEARPDIVIFTGNQIAGYDKDFSNTFTRRRWEHNLDFSDSDLEDTREKIRKHISSVVKPLEDRGIPWVVTYGNHDNQCGLSNAQLDDLYREFSGCLNHSGNISDRMEYEDKNCDFSEESAFKSVKVQHAKGVQRVHGILPNQVIFPCEPGTLALPVKDCKNKDIVFSLVLVDSGDYSRAGGYGEPSKMALDFLSKISSFLPAKFCVFQHFALKQYYDLLREVPKKNASAERAIEGYRAFSGKYYVLDESKVLSDCYLSEGVSCPDLDSGEFAILRKNGTFSIASGHDHRNSFAGREKSHNMLLVSTPTCGFASYGPEPYKRGIRLFEFDIRHPFEPRTQMLEFGKLVGKPSSRKAYTYGLTAESEHNLPEVDLLRKPSIFTRLIHRLRKR